MKRMFMSMFLIFASLLVAIFEWLDFPFAHTCKRWWVKQYRIHIQELPLGIVLAMEIREDWIRDGKI